MNHGYIDPYLTHNSSLACFLLTTFVKRYQACTEGAPVELTKILLVLPLVWHQTSRAAIEGRRLNTPLQSVLTDTPELRIGFRRRVEAFAPPTLQGLNLACSADLLMRTVSAKEIFLECSFLQWPRSSKPTDAPADMVRAIERMAPWFAAESPARLYHHFLKD